MYLEHEESQRKSGFSDKNIRACSLFFELTHGVTVLSGEREQGGWCGVWKSLNWDYCHRKGEIFSYHVSLLSSLPSPFSFSLSLSLFLSPLFYLSPFLSIPLLFSFVLYLILFHTLFPPPSFLSLSLCHFPPQISRSNSYVTPAIASIPSSAYNTTSLIIIYQSERRKRGRIELEDILFCFLGAGQRIITKERR